MFSEESEESIGHHKVTGHLPVARHLHLNASVAIDKAFSEIGLRHVNSYPDQRPKTSGTYVTASRGVS